MKRALRRSDVNVHAILSLFGKQLQPHYSRLSTLCQYPYEYSSSRDQSNPITTVLSQHITSRYSSSSQNAELWINSFRSTNTIGYIIIILPSVSRFFASSCPLDPYLSSLPQPIHNRRRNIIPRLIINPLYKNDVYALPIQFSERRKQSSCHTFSSRA
jgi:hypothetical protein